MSNPFYITIYGDYRDNILPSTLETRKAALTLAIQSHERWASSTEKIIKNAIAFEAYLRGDVIVPDK